MLLATCSSSAGSCGRGGHLQPHLPDRGILRSAHVGEKGPGPVRLVADEGTAPNGPNITGASRSRITNALNGGIPDMDFSPRLTSDEIEAVYKYLLWLTGREE